MSAVDFVALEYNRDATFRESSYRYDGSTETGWRILREGEEHLTLPAGYRLLRSLRCGVCSTDLSRHHLPYALPQITGHEVIAEDDSGTTVAAEINASHAATGSPLADACPFCSRGLPTHCPDRLTLGIDRLPGGFAPWVLVPKMNVVEVPGKVDSSVAVLIEPFAAALRATEQVARAHLNRVAVLGAGRLGLLVVAALKDRRETTGGSFSIEAINRHEERLRIAKALGADRGWDDPGAAGSGAGSRPPFDLVFECTGSPKGLELALGLAAGEVHLKSTTGLASLGLEHVTEMVVDEISLGSVDREALDPVPPPPASRGTALLVGARIPGDRARALESAGYRTVRARRDEDLNRFLDAVRAGDSEQANLAVVETAGSVDRLLRPWPDRDQGAIRPRGTILLVDVGQPKAGLLHPILARGHQDQHIEVWRFSPGPSRNGGASQKGHRPRSHRNRHLPGQ